MTRHRIARLGIAALVAAMSAALPIVGAGPVGAHAQLESSSPADGAVLTSPPTTVSFTFNEPLLPGSTTIAIVDASGAIVSTDPGAIDGPTISAPVTPLPAGAYQASYRVVSADGHPIMGAIAFTVTDAGAGPTASSLTPAASPSAPSNGQTTAASMTPSVIAVAVALVLLVLGVVLLRRRR